jgi:outer membrane protein TolC
MLRRTILLAASFGISLAPSLAQGAQDSAVEPGLSLQEAVRLAESRNERARIADLQVVVAEAAVDRARAGFLPVLTAQGSDQQHLAPTGSAPSNTGQANMTVNQPIVNASAWPLYAQARQLADAQHAQSVDDKRVLAFDASRAFFAVLNAHQVVQAAQRLLDLAKANLADAQARAKAQLASTNDVTRAQIDVSNASREMELDKGSLEAAYVQLSFVVNAAIAPTASGALVVPDATLRAAQEGLPETTKLVRLGLDRRPDLLALRHAAGAAHDFASEPLLRLVPTLGVQGTATATTNPPPTTGRWNDESVTATLTWTLYDAGVRYADKHSRDAQAGIADLTFDTLVRSVDAQVRSTVAQLAASQAAFHAAEQAVTAAGQSVEETTILYRQGLAKAIELVDANDSRFAAEVNYASAQYQMAQAYLNLRQALGLDPLGTELK